MHTPIKHLILLFVSLLGNLFLASSIYAQHSHELSGYSATHHPDRINISIKDNPAYSFAVTWRTDSIIVASMVELAVASDSATAMKDEVAPFEMPNRVSYQASTEALEFEGHKTLHHSYNFSELIPETLYAFRVGDGTIWSEWFQYRTASDKNEAFSFIYLGDAQNNLKSMWSRTIRQAFISAPDAGFILHAGDLINDRHAWEWDEWFQAGSFIHSMIPVVPVAGNHEHYRDSIGEPIYLMHNWTQQFTLPENGPSSSQETDYYFDYQGVRFIVLNSSLFRENILYREEQKKWLHSILSNNSNKWTIISYHIPINDTILLKELKPILEEYDVDMALQGHIHSYNRGITWNDEVYEKGPVYTVSVSGPKFYDVKDLNGFNMIRSGSHKQLYQVINVSANTINYKAYTTTGVLYDEFEIIKENGRKVFLDIMKD
ncbi:metallophosphoesterase family protein [Flavivirga aquimarina]|uniref:Metallophosphoesterase family protein n=1 Tax=Flavivirga aquimarina TaxID=2027862 RepID=A0ABT8W6N4_9FLAO|nr:metallophosphoesterase family protein [Flavivirga aquimarina]MDO5968761.1 metallophosphoesterase family protein [Flavivirga aquimarina]